ncbi:hypothetical protein [Lichenicola sp.]|uniref:hypothetical protein n=1 Tax=Lichenicola sp. TaxID=2804529 RepID=UPI003B008222
MMQVPGEPVRYYRRLAFPACLASAVLSSAFFYMQITFLLLLPVLALFFIVCLTRFGLRPKWIAGWPTFSSGLV